LFPLIASATIDAGQKDAVQGLAQMLGQGPFALVILFISPQADMAALTAGLDAVFADTPVMGCTTAGEIGRDGYAEGQIVAVALPSAHFGAEVLLVPDLDDLSPQALITRLIRIGRGWHAVQGNLRAVPGQGAAQCRRAGDGAQRLPRQGVQPGSSGAHRPAHGGDRG